MEITNTFDSIERNRNRSRIAVDGLHQRWSRRVQNIHSYSPWCCVELNAGDDDVRARSVLFTTHTHTYNNRSNRDCNINYSSGSNGLCRIYCMAECDEYQQIVYLFMHTWDVCHVKGFVGKSSHFTYLFYVSLRQSVN